MKVALAAVVFFWALQEGAGLVRKENKLVSTFLIDDLVYGCLLVPRSGDNVLVIHGYIAAEHRGRLFRLETKRKTTLKTSKPLQFLRV